MSYLLVLYTQKKKKRGRLSTHPSSIDDDAITTDIVTSFARKEHDHALKVIRATPSLMRDAVHDLLRPYWVGDKCVVHLGSDVTRCNRIHVDALGSPFVAERFAQTQHAMFGGGIGGHGESSLETQETGDVDDLSTATRAILDGWVCATDFEHVLAEITRESKDCVEVDLKDLSRSEGERVDV